MRGSVRSVATQRSATRAPQARAGSQERVSPSIQPSASASRGSRKNVVAIARAQSGTASGPTGWTISGSDRLTAP